VCLNIVLRDTPAFFVHTTEKELCGRISLLGRHTVPSHGLFVVLPHAAADADLVDANLIKEAEGELRIPVSLARGSILT